MEMIMRNVNSGKKGQVKIQQMAFMIVTLTIFFILVGLFALSYSYSGLKSSKAALDEKNAMLLVSKLANSPEFSCEGSFGNEKVSCVDFDKVMSLKSSSSKYETFWDFKDIEIRKIYPSTNDCDNEKSIKCVCTEQNYPNCQILKVLSGNSTGNDVSTFVSLCRKESFHGTFYDKCELAKLIVRF